MAIAELVIDFAANLARFQTDLNKIKAQGGDLQTTMTRQFNEVQRSIDAVGATVSKVTGIIATMTGVLAGGAAFGKIISATTQWTGEVVSLSKVLGISTAQASGLNVALRTLGIDQDSVKTATQRLAMSINKDGGAAIEAMGVRTRDTSGNLRSASDVMLDVNEKLSGMKAGLDRNTAAAAIYGKGWLGIIDTLKLTRSEFDEAQEKAKRLHLVIGDEGAAQVRLYKREMADLKLVATSLEVQMGSMLIPTLTKLGAAFSEGGQSGVKYFGKALEEITRGVMQSGVVAGTTIDKTSAWLDSGGLIGQYVFGKKGAYESRISQIDAAAVAQFAEINKLFDSPSTKSKEPSGNLNPNLKTNNEAVAAAVEKYKQFAAAMEAVQLKIDNLNPYLEKSDKLFNEIVAWADKEITANPKYVSAIMKKAEAWQTAADAAKAYHDRMSGIAIGEEEAGASVSSFNFSTGNRDFLKFKPSMLSPGSGTPEDPEAIRDRFNSINEKYMNPADKLAYQHGQNMAEVAALDPSVIGAQKISDLKLKIAEDYQNKVKELDDKVNEQRLSAMSGLMGNIASVLMQGSKKSFEIGKGFAIAQTLIDTYAGAQKAYTSMLSIPVIGPELGIVAAGVAVAAGMMRVSQISSMQYTARAMGGNAYAGGTYLVGEQGPEIIRMGANGFVTPNHLLPQAGGGVAVTNVYQISTGVSETVQAEVMRMAPGIAAMSVKAVEQAINGGTSLSRAVGRMR